MSVNSSRCRRLLPSLAPPARTILPATKRGVKRRRRRPARQREPLSSGAALLAPSMRGAHAPTRPLLSSNALASGHPSRASETARFVEKQEARYTLADKVRATRLQERGVCEL